MAKFSRFDPRNKKNGRHKKITLGEYPKNKKNTFEAKEDRYFSKYKKIDFIEEEADEELGRSVR